MKAPRPRRAHERGPPDALAAVRWGADYLARAHAADETLYVQVGDGDSDHSCWQRPEDMDTPRTSYSVDASRPGSDIAGETAAALAAASVAFRPLDPGYSAMLLGHAEQVTYDTLIYHNSVHCWPLLYLNLMICGCSCSVSPRTTVASTRTACLGLQNSIRAAAMRF